MVQSSRFAQPKSFGMAILDLLMVLGWYAWGMAYWTSIMLLMFWQLTIPIGARPAASMEGLEDIGWETCLKGSLQSRYLSNACYIASSRWVGYVFPWALLLSFYDYKWMEVRRHPGSYVEDRAQYMLCQAVVSSFLALSWWFLGPGGSFKTGKDIIVLSTSCLLVEFFMILTAFTSLKVTYPTQKISLREGRPVMPSLLGSALPESQDGPLGMAFRPTGPSIREHINAAKAPLSKVLSPQKRQTPRLAGQNPQQAKYPQLSQGEPKILNPSFKPASPYRPSVPPTQANLQQSDPDAMDWNPEVNDSGSFSQDYTNAFSSFSEHRPSSPLGYLGRRYEDGNSSEEEDAKTEVNDSPARPRSVSMRPKSLLIDGFMESLFEVAAKLDEAKPMNQPGILIKRAHRIGQEAARLLAVSVGLVVLVSTEGTVACGGLLLAVVVGTCWRFANATLRSESRVLSVAGMWKRNFAVLACLLELCGSVLVSAEMLGFHVLSSAASLPSALPIEPVVPDIVGPLLPDGGVDLSTAQTGTLGGQSQLTQLIIRVLFFSLAAHQTWDFAQVFTYKGTQVVVQPGGPVPKRRSSRDLGLSEPIRSFQPSLSREGSLSDLMRAEPSAPVVSGASFGGLSFGGGGGGGGGSGMGNGLSQRSNFSSWGAQSRDVGIKRPQTERFGATTTRSMKVPPPGVATTPNPWTSGAPPSSSSSVFQRARGGDNWGL
ncbi:hypothetical protein DRE_04863 [Drechslerella stenobrocha 248]|uniref:Uncharacterized protein n=1 Tax=Drechslerella stenobrocha 248 TaxID=1043628 RepID=W7HP35_9PEZI|nr:hypothetical protein DRE_04863 [Drechslerella stenobrocha 248]